MLVSHPIVLQELKWIMLLVIKKWKISSVINNLEAIGKRNCGGFGELENN